MYNETDYLENKNRLIQQLNHAKIGKIQDGMRLLSAQAPDYFNSDLDIAWIRIVLATNYFTRKISLKKAKRLMSVLGGKTSIGGNDFADSCNVKATEYLTECAQRDKAVKKRALAFSVIGIVLAATIIIGSLFVDRSGIIYGTEDLVFSSVDGKTFTAQNVVKYNDYVRLSLPTKTGYKATGVYDSKTGKQMFDSDGVSLSTVQSRSLNDYSECNLVVEYEPKVYAASIATTTGLAVSSFEYTVETIPEDVIDEPQELPGYVFEDWYTDNKFRHRFSGSFSDYADLDKPLVLYAHFILDGWTIKWDLCGGILKGEPIDNYTILSDVTLPDESLVTRTGYHLDGWLLDGKKIDYFTPTQMKDVTLTANWVPNQYAIIYSLNGGELDNPITSYTVEDVVTFHSPYRLGYDFSGWYTSRAYQTVVDGIECGTTGNKTFFAKWTPIEYHLEYDLKGGDNSAYNPSTFTLDSPVFLHCATREGYTFNGWFKDSICENAITRIENIANNVIVYADWTPNTYQANIVPTVGKPYSVSLQYDGYYKLDAPEIEGYTFQEFVILEDQSAFSAQGIYHQASDIVLKARYSANKYYISYYDGQTFLEKQEVYYGEQINYLTPDVQANREFVAWCHDKYLVEQAEEDSYLNVGDISLYADFLSTSTINLAANTEYEIGSQIDKVYFVGTYRDGAQLLENVRIVVACRDAALTLCFDHVGIAAKENESAIQFENSSYELLLLVVSNSYIQGGNGSDGTSKNLNAQSGEPAFSYDGDVSLKAVRSDCTMTFVGGNGGQGHKGADGKNGSVGIVGWDSAGKEGGNGSNGSNGGKGGNGAVALACNKLYVNSNFTLNLVGGNAGAGGDGGRGGDAGRGGYANYQSLNDNVIVDPGRIHGVNGGAGGNGGNGGAPGVRGSAVSGNVVCNNTGATVNKQNGLSANGGVGGRGGVGGAAGQCKYIRYIIIAGWLEDKNGSRGSDGVNGNKGSHDGLAA